MKNLNIKVNFVQCSTQTIKGRIFNPFCAHFILIKKGLKNLHWTVCSEACLLSGPYISWIWLDLTLTDLYPVVSQNIHVLGYDIYLVIFSTLIVPLEPRSWRLSELCPHVRSSGRWRFGVRWSVWVVLAGWCLAGKCPISPLLSLLLTRCPWLDPPLVVGRVGTCAECSRGRRGVDCNFRTPYNMYLVE
jgi:hypothetical protein